MSNIKKLVEKGDKMRTVSLGQIGALQNTISYFIKYEIEANSKNLLKLKEKVTGSFTKRLIEKAIEAAEIIEKSC